MRIGITDCHKEDKFAKYVEWIHSIDPKIELVKLSYESGKAEEISELDGLLLTGGGDLHPGSYGMERKLRETKSVDEHRDEFEFGVIERALDLDLPILGVCRGMQVFNVYLGGTLIVDLVSEGFSDHTSPKQTQKRHAIRVHPHSLIKILGGGLEFEVNSYHHQAVQKLGKGLISSALSADGVIEAVEWVIKDGMPFLVLVQWHPERDVESVMSKNLAIIFLREVQHSIKLKTASLH